MTDKTLAQLRGKHSRAAGAQFENMIDGACVWYGHNGLAKIRKAEEPMKPIRSLGAGRFLACFTKKSEIDYKGVLNGGQMIAFEAKHTDTGIVQQNRLEEWQMADLREFERMGAIAFVLLSYGMERFYRIPFKMWDDMKNQFGRVSLREADIPEYRISVKSGRLQILEGLVDGEA